MLPSWKLAKRYIPALLVVPSLGDNKSLAGLASLTLEFYDITYKPVICSHPSHWIWLRALYDYNIANWILQMFGKILMWTRSIPSGRQFTKVWIPKSWVTGHPVRTSTSIGEENTTSQTGVWLLRGKGEKEKPLAKHASHVPKEMEGTLLLSC